MNPSQSSPPNTDKLVTVGNRGIELHSLDDLLRMSTIVVGSGLAPKGDTPQAVAVKMQLGLELGLTPMSSLKNIAVINGRPGIFGDAGKALLLASGKLDGAPKIAWSGNPTGDDWTCTVTMKRVGLTGEFVGTYSVARAKRANLWRKAGPWSNDPDRQLEWRAWWYAARDGFADVLGGIGAGEELQDIEPEAPREVAVETAKPRSIAALAETMPAETNGAALARAVQADLESEEAKWAAIKAESKRTVQPPGENEATRIWDEHHARFTKESDRKEVAPLFDEAPAPATIYLWWKDEQTELEVPFMVPGEYWDAWADEELPQGSKLALLCKSAKVPTTWRSVSLGAPGGARHKQLVKHVEDALTGLAGGTKPSRPHVRAACTLAVLLNLAKKATPASETAETLFQ